MRRRRAEYELDLNENGSALWVESHQENESACTVLQEACRTLKAARAKQNQVNKAQEYYQPRSKDARMGLRDLAMTPA